MTAAWEHSRSIARYYHSVLEHLTHSYGPTFAQFSSRYIIVLFTAKLNFDRHRIETRLDQSTKMRTSDSVLKLAEIAPARASGGTDEIFDNFVTFYIGLVTFYPRDAMLARVFATATCLSVCPSVCLSVTRRYCLKTKKVRVRVRVRVMISWPSGSPTMLVFWCQISSQ